MAEKSTDRTTDYKKIYCQHVQETIDLKKHIRGLETEKQKRNQELSNGQVDFKRKYQKYIDGSLSPAKRAITLDPLRTTNGPKNLPPIYFKHRRSSSVGENMMVTKNIEVQMPVDFPYSFQSWRNMVDTGCRDGSGKSPLEMMRENLIREPVPELSTPISRESSGRRRSIAVMNSRDSIEPSPRVTKSEATTPRVNKGEESPKVMREEMYTTTVNDVDSSITVRWIADGEKPPVGIMRETSNILSSRQKQDKNINKEPKQVKINLEVVDLKDRKKNDIVRENSVKFPSVITRSKTDLTDYNTCSSDDNTCDEYMSDDASTSDYLKTPNHQTKTPQKRQRSNSLTPTMLRNFQWQNPLLRSSIIEEDPPSSPPLSMRLRSKSYTEIDKLRDRLKSTIKEKTAMDKAALQVMMNNSKGLKKFKYLTKLVNVGLREMDTPPKKTESLEREKTEADIFACRYLRVPQSQKDNNDESMNSIFE